MDSCFLLLGLFFFYFFALSNFAGMMFVLPYIFAVFCCYLLEVSYFLMRDCKGVDLDVRGSEEELEGVEGFETVIRIYYIRKK